MDMFFQEKKIIIFQFPACFSQGAHDVQSPNTVNKLAAISRVNVTLGHKMSWEPREKDRQSPERSQCVATAVYTITSVSRLWKCLACCVSQLPGQKAQEHVSDILSG